MDQAFADIQAMFMAGAIKIMLSLLYLVVPILVAIIVSGMLGVRGRLLRFIGLAGTALGFYLFVVYGLPSVTN